MSRIIIAALALAGCAQSAVYKDPATGQVQQCTANNIPATLPLLAQSEIDKCAAALERAGWKKQ